MGNVIKECQLEWVVEVKNKHARENICIHTHIYIYTHTHLIVSGATEVIAMRAALQPGTTGNVALGDGVKASLIMQRKRERERERERERKREERERKFNT